MSITNMHGNKITERCARAALPILVRQANAKMPIYYGVLADEIGLKSNQQIGTVLGIIADAINELGHQWGEVIPPLQGLAVSKMTDRPSYGFGYAVSYLADYHSMTPSQQNTVTRQVHIELFDYQKWPAVLKALDLKPAPTIANPTLIESAASLDHALESEAHKRLKEYVAANPAVVGKGDWRVSGEIEYSLPSADCIDVLFRTPWTWLAVEVKAANADTAEILRGLFQCVKYQALLEALAKVSDRRLAIETVLVLEGKLPGSLIATRNSLGLTVVENVTPV